MRFATYLLLIHFTFHGLAVIARAGQPFVVSVEGNQRTRTGYIEKLVNDCLERQDQGFDRNFDLSILRQCLINSGLFSEVSISNDTETLYIKVEEKWTFIPVPIVTGGSGETRSAGLFAFESNFLGMGMILGGGGAISNNGTTYFATLSDPSLFFTNWQYNVLLHRQSNKVYLYEGQNKAEGLNETAMEYALGLGYRWHPWTINLAGVRQEKAFKKLSPYHEPQDNKASKAKITLRYEQLNYKLYFHEGLSLRSEIKVDAFRSDEKSNATQFDIRAGWQETMFERQVLQVLVATGGTRGGAIHDSNRIGGGRGFRGIDAKTAWAESYGALAIDYQIPIAHYASGALTIAPFIDAGRIANRGGNNAIINYAAMGGGVYYFLKKIALPGLGLEYGYNTSYLKVFVAFSMGLSL